MLKSLFKKIFSTSNERLIKKLQKEIKNINDLEVQIALLSDGALRNKTAEFKERLSKGETLDDILYEAFAVVREASKRVTGLRHFDVQLIGGIILHRGMISEMKTGEGKTLVATLPAYLNALTGKGVHIVSVNDYLIARDSSWIGRIYQFLDLKVGCITSGISSEERKAAYGADITYITNNELGFDYLRDNMRYSEEHKCQKELNFAIVDEVDSILIDEARTPLIISGPVEHSTKLYNIINDVIYNLEKEDYEKDEKIKNISLTEAGTNKIEALLLKGGLIKEGSSLYDFDNMALVHHVNQALKANFIYRKDVDYLVQNRSVLIIDEFTGRIMEGRRFSDGLHQALEAKEGVDIKNENQTLASITFQNYFRMYKKVAGMTGSAMTEANELKHIYNLEVVEVPTNKQVRRVDHEDDIYGTVSDKYNAIIKHIKQSHDKGQPILIGTVSIEKSESISKLLKTHNVPHHVLNAKFHEQEAYIIAQAGRYRSVTVATNMAGRGTDIMLGGNPEMIALGKLGTKEYDSTLQAAKEQVEEEKKKVIEAGGLLVIGTERHESRRIDNQLRGRSGRQGDPGETKFYLSLEDDLMRIFASERTSNILRMLGLKNEEAINHPLISRALEKAQQKVEAHNYEIRKTLLKYDDVMNDQRHIIYDQRSEILSSESVQDIFKDMLEDVNRELVAKFIPAESYRDQWNLEGLIKEIYRIYNVDVNLEVLQNKEIDEIGILAEVNNISNKVFEYKEANFGDQMMRLGEKHILILTLDQVWKDHLWQLDHLRQGIHLRAYGQKDPLNEYKREAFMMFDHMLTHLKWLFIERMAHFYIDSQDQSKLDLESQAKQRQTFETRIDPALRELKEGVIETSLQPLKVKVNAEDRDPNDSTSWGKVLRNELCPCNSGKKYKHCHG